MSFPRGGWSLGRELCGLLVAAGLLAAAVVHAAPRGIRAWPDSAAGIRERLARGEYADAEAASRRWVALFEDQSRVDSLRYAEALDLFVESLWRNHKPADPAAQPAAERAHGIKLRRLGEDDPGVAASLSNLGELAYRTRAYDEALSCFRRALAIRERALGRDDPAVARSLVEVALILEVRQDTAGVREVLERARAIVERPGRPATPMLATVLNAQGSLCVARKDDAGARLLFERAVKVWEETVPEDHPHLAFGREQLAAFLQARSEYKAAQPLLERAIAAQASHFGPWDLALGRDWGNLGIVRNALGDYPGARLAFEQCIQILEHLQGADSIELAQKLRRLAGVLERLGEYSNASLHAERSLQIAQRRAGPRSLEAAASLAVLSQIRMGELDPFAALRLAEQADSIATERYPAGSSQLAYYRGLLTSARSRLGDAAGARADYESLLREQSTSLPPDDIVLAPTLLNLANELVNLRLREKAGPYYERALAIRERALGPDNVTLCTTLNMLGRNLLELADLTRARQCFERSVTISERALGPENPQVAKGLVLLAELEYASGDASRAADLLERARRIDEAALGAANPACTDDLYRLAYADLALGRRDSAFVRALRSESASVRMFELSTQALPGRLMLTLAGVRTSALPVLFALGGSGLETDRRRATWSALIRSRGLVVDALAERHGRTREALQCADALATASRDLANLIMRGPGPDEMAIYRERLEKAGATCEAAERQLAGNCPTLERARVRSRIGFEEVARALPESSALLAFARVESPAPPGAMARPARHDEREPEGASLVFGVRVVPTYYALVLAPGSRDPEIVSLGSALEIDSLVSHWRNEMGPAAQASGPVRSEARSRRWGEALRRRVWDPVAPLFRGAQRVFLVPDAELNLVNFAALPARGGSYLVETAPLLQTLSSERDLVPDPEREASGSGLLVLGGPAFDDAPEPPRAPLAAESGSATMREGIPDCADLAALRFTALPAARLEAEHVAKQWRSALPAGSHDVLRLTGPGATESAFKLQAPGNEVIHLATHAWMLDARCSMASATHVGTTATGAGTDATPAGAPQDPLLRCGLALAGSNQRGRVAEAAEDGMLTAGEIAALDLRGVECAVLSGCGTGTGEARTSEGVFGLRRAFRIAGVRSLVMSLWSVGDEATAFWMHEFYRARLGEHRPIAEAARAAGLAVLRARRQAGRDTHPSVWGAFVATGTAR